MDLFFSFLSFFLRLCSEVPLLEDTLMRILVIGLSRDLPLGPADAMELADHLVKRAAGVQSDGLWKTHFGCKCLWLLLKLFMINSSRMFVDLLNTCASL